MTSKGGFSEGKQGALSSVIDRPQARRTTRATHERGRICVACALETGWGGWYTERTRTGNARVRQWNEVCGERAPCALPEKKDTEIEV
jgi:hypothetical protein